MSNTAMVSGVYPLGPHALRLAAGRASGAALGRGRLATEWALGVGVSVGRPLGLLGARRAIWTGPAPGPRPVVLVHGYAMSRAYFLLLAARLSRAGLGPFFGFEYWTLGKVASAARRLGDYVEELLERHPGADGVDLVGHSMGGVVARYYLAFGGGAARVRHLVTLGSPHRGTPTSHFGLGRPQRELLPGSSLMMRLEAAGLPPGTEVVAIWSRGDALVWSEEHAELPGARHVVFDDLGHLGLLASRRVAREVTAVLTQDRPAPVAARPSAEPRAGAARPAGQAAGRTGSPASTSR